MHLACHVCTCTIFVLISSTAASTRHSGTPPIPIIVQVQPRTSRQNKCLHPRCSIALLAVLPLLAASGSATSYPKLGALLHLSHTVAPRPRSWSISYRVLLLWHPGIVYLGRQTLRRAHPVGSIIGSEQARVQSCTELRSCLIRVGVTRKRCRGRCRRQGSQSQCRSAPARFTSCRTSRTRVC